MAYTISNKDTNHLFEKQNLVTLTSKDGGYDSMICKYCGIKAKAITLGTYTFSDRVKKDRATTCNKLPESKKGKKVKITYCNAGGGSFENLTPDSIHDVIDPPKGQDNNGGVWVMGVGEPVKILRREFNYLED